MVRIAQRLGLHSEACNLELSPFEAEMRRRLWWQIVLFDSRVSELAHSKTTSEYMLLSICRGLSLIMVKVLNHSWDCQVPRNVSDGEIHPQLSTLPTPLQPSTDSVFMAVLCEVAHVVRHADFYQALFTSSEDGSGDTRVSLGARELEELEQKVDIKYKAYQDAQSPLHLMTFCMKNIHISRWRLADSICNAGGLSSAEHRENVFHHAIRMIESDSTVYSCPLTRGFRWLLKLNVPFPAYVYVVKELRRHLFTPAVEHAWEALATNFEVRGLLNLVPTSPVLQSFRQMSMKAWESQRNNLPPHRELVSTPRLISLFLATMTLEHRVMDITLRDINDCTDTMNETHATSSQSSNLASDAPHGDTKFSGFPFDQFQPWTQPTGWVLGGGSDNFIFDSTPHPMGSGGLGNADLNMLDDLWRWS